MPPGSKLIWFSQPPLHHPKVWLRISTDLGFALGDVVDSRSSEEEVALLPGLLAVLLQPQGALDLRHGHRAAAETLLMLEAEDASNTLLLEKQQQWQSAAEHRDARLTSSKASLFLSAISDVSFLPSK